MKTSTEFIKFNPNMIDFLEELEQNNNKQWFDEHREFYTKEIREPLKSFVSKSAEMFISKGMKYIADPKKSLFRINRDLRFSKNKAPYKNNLGVFYPYTLSQTIDKKPESLGLYLHIEPTAQFIAGGVHCPKPPVLKAIRNKLLDDWQEFEEIINDNNFKKEFPQILVGDSLFRMPRGFPKEHPAEKYIKLKEFTVYCNISKKDLFSDRLLDIIENKATVLEDFNAFLFDAIVENTEF